ncbi:hypothetical protein G3M48_005742 [Beauveria asiatica]|uniref:Uncharacterized protein n=1 Tax=Beauveria asiatica TaxID=1069075 RepID=A0AAW0RR66_9HYPO
MVSPSTTPARFPAISSSKKVSLQIWLPFLAFAWGIITIGIGSMREYKDFMILQAVLGIFEGGPFPGIVLYFSRMCTRGELAVRISVLYTGGSLSGAFGGLLACGLSAIGPRGRLERLALDIYRGGCHSVLSSAKSHFSGLDNA